MKDRKPLHSPTRTQVHHFLTRTQVHHIFRLQWQSLFRSGEGTPAFSAAVGVMVQREMLLHRLHRIFSMCSNYRTIQDLETGGEYEKVNVIKGTFLPSSPPLSHATGNSPILRSVPPCGTSLILVVEVLQVDFAPLAHAGLVGGTSAEFFTMFQPLVTTRASAIIYDGHPVWLKGASSGARPTL